MHLRTLLLLSGLSLVAGCGLPQALLHDPFRHDYIRLSDGKDLASVHSMDASRRLTVMLADGKFCAEPPPDTANTFDAGFRAGVSAKAGATTKLGEAALTLDDRFNLTPSAIVGARAPEVEIFRTGVFALCNYLLIGAITKEQLPEIFKDLVARTTARLNLPASGVTQAATPTEPSPGETQSLQNAARTGAKAEQAAPQRSSATPPPKPQVAPERVGRRPWMGR